MWLHVVSADFIHMYFCIICVLLRILHRFCTDRSKQKEIMICFLLEAIFLYYVMLSNYNSVKMFVNENELFI